jgi:hypothetical protein
MLKPRVVATIAMSVGYVVAATAAEATTLTGILTGDNSFTAYIGTTDASAGTLVASGNNWQNAASITPTALTPGQDYFLQVEVTNYDLQAGLIGSFSLIGSGFQFADGSQTLTTSNLADWQGSINNSSGHIAYTGPAAPIYTVTALPSWVQPTGSVTSFGDYTVGPWFYSVNGFDNIHPPTWAWIWPSDAETDSTACTFCTVDFSTEITPTPLPSSLPLFVAGLGSLALLGWRKKRMAPASVRAV